MKIAILSTVPAVPPTEGNRSRIFAFIKALRGLGHDVHLVYLPSSLTDAPDDAAHVSEFGADHYVRLPSEVMKDLDFRLKRGLFRLKRKLAGYVSRDFGSYCGLDEFYPRALTQHLRRLQEAQRFDAVVCEYIFHSAALEAFPPSVLKILDTHDSFSDRHKLFSRKSYWFSVPPSEQARAFRRADVVIAIQEAESELFRRQVKTAPPQVAVVSHLLDLSHPVSDFSPASAIFVGSGNVANQAAVTFFTQSVLPFVLQKLPEFNLLLAGSICRHVADHPAVVKLGVVEHLRDAYARAPLSVNPMLSGTGINIKLLDAMAAGVATVSTETGARGLSANFRNGVTVVADDDAAAFATAVVELASSEPLRRARGQGAHQDAVAWNEAQLSVLGRILSRDA